jgi:hypothetical protein
MSKRQDRRDRRRLSLRRETLRKLSDLDLGRIAGGTDTYGGCEPDTVECDTGWMSGGSRLC